MKKNLLCCICVAAGAVLMLNPGIAGVLPICVILLWLFLFIAFKMGLLIDSKRYALMFASAFFICGFLAFCVYNLSIAKAICALGGIFIIRFGAISFYRVLKSNIANKKAPLSAVVSKSGLLLMAGVILCIYPLETTSAIGVVFSFIIIGLGIGGLLRPGLNREHGR